MAQMQSEARIDINIEKQTSVGSLLADHDKQIEHLHMLAKDLEDKLAPILGPSDPDVSEMLEEVRPACSPLALDLRRKGSGLEGLAVKLRGMLGRLEI